MRWTDDWAIHVITYSHVLRTRTQYLTLFINILWICHPIRSYVCSNITHAHCPTYISRKEEDSTVALEYYYNVRHKLVFLTIIIIIIIYYILTVRFQRNFRLQTSGLCGRRIGASTSIESSVYITLYYAHIEPMPFLIFNIIRVYRYLK